jgi:hypothetical protein
MNKRSNWLFITYVFLLFVISFSLQLNKIGNTLDEWVIVYAHLSAGNDNLSQYAFLVNRPNVAWVWQLGFPLLGYKLINWQIFSLFWRFSAVILTWLVWQEIWPEQDTETKLAASLFAVYPIFAQQQAAISFAPHWLCLSAFSLSVLLMIYGVKKNKHRILYIIGSILLSAGHIFTMEYFVGLELTRPIILWLVISKEREHYRKKIIEIIKWWAPYLLLVISYVPYRLFWMPSPGYDRNSPDKLINLIKDPIHFAGTWILTAIRDFTYAALGAWQNTLKIEDISIESSLSLMALIVTSIVVIISLLYFLYSFNQNGKHKTENSRPWYGAALILGIISFLVGLAPIWSINNSLTPVGLYSDRFSLPILSGVSLTIIAFLSWLSNKPKPKIITICVLIGLAAGFQYRVETRFANSWVQQKRIYTQMKWRIPDIENHTAFYGDGVIADYMGSWADIAALNTIYPYRENSFDNTWYINSFKPVITEELQPNIDRRYYKRENLEYIGNTSNSLVIQIKSQPGQCVWVLTEEDLENPFMSEYLIPPLHLSNPDRIIPDGDPTLREDVFGEELPHTWCYYFERADLARQQQDWNIVMDLWHEAETNSYQPAVPVEYRPFIEAAAYTGNFDLAIELTEKANDNTVGMRSYLCGTWENIKLDSLDQIGPSEQLEKIIQCATLNEDKRLIQENEK